MKKVKPSLLILLLLFLIGAGRIQAQCASCGNGSEGAFNATSNTTIAGGVHNFTTFNIDPGVVVRVTGSQPLEINATGMVTINGTLDVSGLNGADGITYTQGGAGAIGVAGGGNGGAGSYSSSLGPLDGASATGLGAGAFGSGWSGGGGAGYAATGGASGGAGGAGGPVYGVAQLTGNTAGSGGGGGSGGYSCGAGGGGAGGGFVSVISCASISITGTINANGGNGGSDGTGNCGGGGAGSGGSIWLGAPFVTNNGTLTAIGGMGGASTTAGSPYFGVGGAGSVGRVRIDGSVSGSGTVNPATGFTAAFGNNPVIDSIVGTDVSCFGGTDGSATAFVSGGTGAYTYSWNPAAGNTATVVGLAAACYEILVTDSAGCTASDSICVNQPAQLAVSLSQVGVLCNGACDGSAAALVSGGVPSYSFLWNNGSTTDSISNLCAGNYQVTVVDVNGCMITNSVSVTEPTALQLSETHLDASFGNSDGSGSVQVSGGTPSYSYLWSPTGDTTSSASNLAPGTYSVLVTDANGCADTITVVIGELVGTSDPAGVQVQLYPNPASGSINFTLLQDNASEVKLKWFDAQGKLVSSQSFAANTTVTSSLDLTGMPAGIYLCRVETGEKSITRTITVQ